MESEVAHSNPFAALDAAGEGSSPGAAPERGSDDGSEASMFTAVDLEGHLDNGEESSAAECSPEGASGMHSSMDLAAQRQAILASLRGSSAGV